MAKSIRSVSAMVVDFFELARTSDAAIVARMQFHLKNSRKRVFPQTVEFNAYRVTRESAQITIHLLLDRGNGAMPQEVARYAFVPPPDFSRRFTST